MRQQPTHPTTSLNMAVLGIGTYGCKIIDSLMSHSHFAQDEITTISINTYADSGNATFAETLSSSNANQAFLLDDDKFFGKTYSYRDYPRDMSTLENQLYLKGYFGTYFNQFHVLFVFSGETGRLPTELTMAISFYISTNKATSSVNSGYSFPLIVPIINQYDEDLDLRYLYQPLTLLHHLETYGNKLILIKPSPDERSLNKILPDHIALVALYFFIRALRQTGVIDYCDNTLLDVISDTGKAVFVTSMGLGYHTRDKQSNNPSNHAIQRVVEQTINQLNKQWFDLSSPEINTVLVDIVAQEFYFTGYDVVSNAIHRCISDEVPHESIIEITSRKGAEIPDDQVQISMLAIKKE